MSRAHPDRRKLRSQDAHTALSLQLAQVRLEAQLEAVVLATAEGLLVAHAGDSELCSELAAVAPLVSAHAALPANTNLGSGLMHVQTVPWQDAPLYLACCADDVSSTGSQTVVERIGLAQAGVARILAA
jgi:hypothetical protein